MTPHELIARAPAALGYMILETERGERTYLLGSRTTLDGDVPILDWRTSPLAEVFFRHGDGEAYELDIDGKITAGTVRAGSVITNHDPLVVTSRDVEPHPAPIPGTPREIAALPVLDPEQQAAVDLPGDTSLVVDGEAGVGKTLVALYRVASLQRRSHGRFRPLVLVPTEGLRRLCRMLADKLGIAKLEIAVLDTWLVERARTAFPGLPNRLSENATAQVIALKRHPAVRAVCRDFIGWKAPRTDDKLPKSRVRLLHLFGDRDRLQRVVDGSAATPGGALPTRAIEQTMKHTRAQFETTTERAMRHVDADRLQALDGRSLDSGTPMEDARTIDAEDVPVLFELARIGALQASGELPRYDHIVVDEAQLRAPLELAAIGDALMPHGTITLAGDHRQATDETAYFTGWQPAKSELRRPRWSETTLAVSYRSVPVIADFARDWRLPSDPPADPAVWATRCTNGFHQAAQLCWQLDHLRARDDWRQIAVIARTPEHARRLHAELSRGLDPVLVLDGDFRFEPGILVTTAAAVSGLEFDCVVIPDLTPSFYPDTPELRRSLYVAATRARDWLWLLTPDQWSPLVTLATPGPID